MRDGRGYRWGTLFFALVLAGSSAILPFALRCCAHVPAEDFAPGAGSQEWAPGFTRLAIALLDWPMGFRRLVLTIAAACLCLAAAVAGFFALRRMQPKPGQGGSGAVWLGVVEAVLGSLMVGVLYILAAYASGYFGYVGPGNLSWFLGVPLAIAFLQQACPVRALLWTIPLLLGGFLCMGILSMSIGIPLD